MEVLELSDYREYSFFYTVGIFGFLCSIVSLIFIVGKPVLHNAFGYICAAHSIAECGILGIFVFWGAVVTLGPKDLETSILNVIMAHILNIFYYSALYLHLLKSINRFCAIVFPIKYRIWFSNALAKVWCGIAFGLGFLSTVPLFWHECNSSFSGSTYRYQTRTSHCEMNVIFYLDFITCCTTMSIALCCDLITFSFFRVRSKKANSSTRNDLKLALHACLTTLLYMIMIFSFYMLSLLASDLWSLFSTTTMAWMLCHALNQLSFVIFVLFLHGKSNGMKPAISVIQITSIQKPLRRKASEPIKSIVRNNGKKPSKKVSFS